MTFEEVSMSDARDEIKAARQVIGICKAKTMDDLVKVLNLMTNVVEQDYDIRLMLGIRAVRRIALGRSESKGAANV